MFDLMAQVPAGVDASTIAAGQTVAQQVAEQLSANEWLGPLAPIALSPFFGLAALSGIATYGPEWLQQRSAMFSSSGPLHSPVLFWTLAALALFTSLPRLSKVSKPIALAAEKLETYSAIIILLVVRLLSGGAEASSLAGGVTETQAVMSAGVLSLPLDLLMAVLAALNVLIVNAVKLFFEFLVWLTPFPLIDAMLEVANKSICAAMIGLYCFSPALATGLDLILLVLCALAFGWIYRQTRYYRELIAGPLLSMLLPQWFAQRGETMTAFLDSPVGGLPRWTAVTLSQVGTGGCRLHGRWLWKRLELHGDVGQTSTRLLGKAVEFKTQEGTTVWLLHRHWVASDAYGSSSQLTSVTG